ncbi:U3 small nucleolar RNA-associated protein 18 homolog [Chenopodium quinoa]|uniref:U3 small nucleolar RNA-associated protein 18 homolog n=1 Tax=Chenopodium quinoa TaxID=63459 RepID=UPI000B7714DC|nr:U3 small nucleolar RNA-associated protein 18 homolog [Chenopodium quinoa]XP_021762092.1 U3 small nucleolar RNA-associated protein 18 homolog [Chenopodium quinoa]XP_021762093.1 U3 small nucleolar RNA-associated protein 18 homolog [Chenopodium quinoa]
MSLISQNAVVKNKVKKKSKWIGDEGEEPSLLKGREESFEKEGSDVEAAVTHKKRKKRNDAEEKKMLAEEELEMQKLGNFLFGSLHSPVEFGKGDEDEDEDEKGGLNVVDSALFVLDRSGNKDVLVNGEDGGYQAGIVDEDGDKQRKPAWMDDEEETVVNISKVNRLRKLRKEEDETVISGSAYVSRLRAHHAKLNPGTDWANLDAKVRTYDSDEESEVDNGAVVASGYKNVDNILKTNEELVVKRGGRLLPGILEYSRLVDANAEDPSNGPINSVQFHRNHQLLLAAGLDRKLRFFQIDGKRNKMMDSIFIEDCPIRKASFLPDGSQVIVSGRRKFFYSVDISKGYVDKIGPLTGREEKSLEVFEVSPDSRTIAFLGNEGYILLVSAKTKELIGTLKMNGTARSLAFTDDGQQLLSSGGDGHVYSWDLRTRTCLHKGVDEGSINGTALCTAPVGNLFAVGSSSGIVNVYNREEFLGGKRKPVKILEHLRTEASFMKFNHDAQILAICSTMQKSSLKLVHIPSFTVFSNWPPANRTLHYPRCLDFSPAGGFMAAGNAAGKVLLYKLHHYQQA